MKRCVGLFGLFSFLLFLSFGLSSAATLNLWDVFPRYAQGENGVYLKAYDESSGQTRELTWLSEYSFGTYNPPWNIPYIARYDSPWIVTHPRGWELGGQEETFLLLSFPQEVYINSISGSVSSAWDVGDVNFTIVGSRTGGPSWTLYDVRLYSGEIPYFVGSHPEPIQFLAFNVTPNGYSYDDTTLYSATIDYTPVPLPSSMLLLGSALPLLPFLRRKV